MSEVPTVTQKYEVVIKEDPRFLVSVREFKIAILFWLFSLAATGLLAFSLFPKEPVGVTLTLGFPTPIFWVAIFVPIVLIIATFLVVKYAFQEVSLDEYEGGNQ